MIKCCVNLYEHQKTDVLEFKNKNAHALFHDLGVGKTITTIAHLSYKYNQNGGVLNTLVFAPLAVLHQWEQEFHTYYPGFDDDVFILRDLKEKSVKSFKEKKIIITNYEKVISDKFYNLITSKKWDAIVLDESMRIKNPKAKTTIKILKLSNARYKYILSGTPNPQGFEDLWSQFFFLDRCLGENYYVFKNKFFEDKNIPKRPYLTKYFPDWQLRKGAEKEILDKIKPITSVVKKDECLDLPPLIKMNRYTELSLEQKKAYKEMERDFITYVKGEACVANIALTKLIRLQQINAGFSMTNKGIIRFDDNPRINTLVETIEEIPPNEQFIIWTNYKETYQHISYKLEELGIEYGIYTGQESMKEKSDAIRRFKLGEARCLIANPASAGVGLNLQEASCMIYYQNTYSLMLDTQSEARCYRGGSEIHDKVIRINIIAKGTVDEAIHKALDKKMNGLEYLMNSIRIIKEVDDEL